MTAILSIPISISISIHISELSSASITHEIFASIVTLCYQKLSTSITIVTLNPITLQLVVGCLLKMWRNKGYVSSVCSHSQLSQLKTLLRSSSASLTASKCHLPSLLSSTPPYASPPVVCASCSHSSTA